ncbi:MAG: hypothetical protein KME28_20985 [Pelatocladus maniniholoensis HA4357-MV3]|jgi:hypothetical protein|uniref:PhoD-like phosphatase metallophosphatase domain-containing protein n=1 Tax=Pelatocladus maniniholoensis HA4357-MV3 TaxID=1117104 RepID=A0A9E3HAN2_9NOST|nr:hypothetical protein [Pelatocladus maniniholoensis HA4357-MV3]BAZ66638.1 hypothetical protein NIES4106_13900 [Fischerella sp. NIES-4106]
MAWTSLRERIHQLPLVLAGPILRHTAPNSVTVWIALKESRIVTLKILDTNKNLLLTGSRVTIKLGINLYIVAVTARTNENILQYGENYLYDLEFGNEENISDPGILNTNGSIREIIYPPYDLPSFELVPYDLKDLRIVHGSCRKPHGESLDAFTALDKMIKEALVEEPKKRPHQLFLTGDQIYADDVADALLFMLIDAGETLLGWSEKLPDVTDIKELQAGQRNNLATYTAGLTASITKLNKIANIAKSHLFTFSDFCTMYLFAWCDVLWPKPEDLPTFADVNQNLPPLASSEDLFLKELGDLKSFQTTLKQVRRALANIPTYMIFDDHEITDDWYLNMAWCDRVLSKPLGRRILQNGLLAYAICQAWGNTPDEFIDGKPGEGLLKAAVGWFAFQGQNLKYEQEITRRIGLPSIADIRNSHPRQIPHTDASLKWHYTVTGPEYEVIVLDTRTWRAFPGKDFDFPGLLSKEACDQQITKVVHPKNAKVTFVISPGPVVGVPFLEAIQKTAKAFAEKFGSAAWGFDPEAWGLETTAFERLLACLVLRALPAKQSRVIILSGDVHYSFASCLKYAAICPFEHSENIKTELIAIQFTSSSFKNEVSGTGGSHSLHKKGFLPIEKINYLPKAEILGWENKDEQELEIGVMHVYVDHVPQCIPWTIKTNPATIDLLKERGWHKELQVIKKPEWWYKINFVLGKDEKVHEPKDTNLVQPQSITAPLPGQNRKLPLEKYLAMAKNHRDYLGKWGAGKAVVGVNNIGEITFEVVDGKQIAVQTIWWRLESLHEGELLEPFPLTRYEVFLE